MPGPVSIGDSVEVISPIAGAVFWGTVMAVNNQEVQIDPIFPGKPIWVNRDHWIVVKLERE